MVAVALAAVAGLAVGGARGAAHAGGAGVVVVPAARSAATADEVTRAVAAASDADPEPMARARAARAAGAVPVEELAGFAQVGRLLAEGWRAYQVEVDAEYAASRLAAARSRAEALLVLPGGLEVYAEVSLHLGLVLGRLGRRDEAAEALRLAHALDRGRVVTTAEFAPDDVAAYDAAVAQVPPVATVTITASARAELTVDGRAVGRAPLTLTLGHGQHVVVARAPGRAPRGVAVSVGPEARPIVLDLERAPGDGGGGAVGLPAGADDADAVVADTLVFAELDELFVVASVYRGGSPALLGQRCVLARPACTPVVELGHVDGGLDAAARALVERLRAAALGHGVLLTRDVRVASGERGGGGHRRCGWCRDPWVLGGGGAVVIAAVVATVLVLSADAPVPVVTIDPGDFTR
ncbi:MAG: hypothetical protein KJZ91_28135 [Myxococcales bacterium]|nr:hypothetical protein [Myxococcales bacterium]